MLTELSQRALGCGDHLNQAWRLESMVRRKTAVAAVVVVAHFVLQLDGKIDPQAQKIEEQQRDGELVVFRGTKRKKRRVQADLK